MIEDLLIKTGVPSYKTTIEVTFPTSPQNQFELGDKVPTNVAWIYGLAVHTDGTHPTDNNKNLITLAQANNLWLTLKEGTKDFTQFQRLSTMCYENNAGIRASDGNYMPVSIPMGIDWKKSVILNPTGIISPAPPVSTCMLMDIYFLDVPTYANLVSSGVIWKSGIKPVLV